MTRVLIALAAASIVFADPVAGGVTWVRERVTIPPPAHDGSQRPLQALIQRPNEPPTLRRPALIVIGGLETGARVLDLITPDAPVALATFEYPYDGPRRFEFPRTLLDAPKIKAAVARTPDDLLAVHAFLRTKDYVDRSRLCVVGASFGAPFALRAAADDPRVRCLVLIEGFADVRGTAEHRMRQLWTGKLGPLARPLAWMTARALASYLDWPAPEKDAPRLRAGQRVLVIEARDDALLPEASRRLLWEALGRSRAQVRRVVIPGGHLLAGRSLADIRRIAGIVRRWLAIEAS